MFMISLERESARQVNRRALVVLWSMLLFASLPQLIDSAAAGTIAVYTDRAAWEAAAGGPGAIEDFDSFAVDTLYGLNSPLSAGFLTLDVVGTQSDDSWRIDVPPERFPSFIPTVNGTPFATTLYNSFYGGTRLSFAPTTAIGFDYKGGSYSNGDGRGTLTTSLGDHVTLDASIAASGFIGLIYVDASTFTSLTWASSNSQFAAGIDNVETFGPSSVPDAGSALGMLSLGLVGIAIGSRWVNGRALSDPQRR
jgi:hypothetical protein